ncbi:MAG: ATP phosphoribosyltransferase [Methyloligellaceae bacterium]
MNGNFVLAIPSKGRLMEQALDVFSDAGLPVKKSGHERGYQGNIGDIKGAEVAFLSASEIAQQLKSGHIHMGVTGEDLIRETISDSHTRVNFMKRLGFGYADVVVAVPDCWIDVQAMADLEDVSVIFRREHGRRLRVATKYMNLTRQFFAGKGVTGYRNVESLGATEGTPAAGSAELVVDITSTGATLEANHLRILDDGVILESEACLVVSQRADWFDVAADIRTEIAGRLGA